MSSEEKQRETAGENFVQTDFTGHFRQKTTCKSEFKGVIWKEIVAENICQKEKEKPMKHLE